LNFKLGIFDWFTSNGFTMVRYKSIDSIVIATAVALLASLTVWLAARHAGENDGNGAAMAVPPIEND